MDTTKENSGEAQADLVRKFVRQLSEHFESVQIFTSTHLGDSKGTRTFSFGSGNIYSRVGQVREWIVKHDEQARQEVRVEE